MNGDTVKLAVSILAADLARLCEQVAATDRLRAAVRSSDKCCKGTALASEWLTKEWQEKKRAS